MLLVFCKQSSFIRLMSSSVESSLAAPGAGLPRHELFLGRLFFALARWSTSQQQTTEAFQKERRAIHTLLASCPPEKAAQRVLIARPRGLEDSSRYWSVWMTLEHLRIVHRSLIRVIHDLSREIIPEGRASTADVKPGADVTEAVVTEYECSCDDLLHTIAKAPTLRSHARYAHPWFGPLNAAGWHALSATHLRIHRVQIERILAAQNSKPVAIIA